MQHAAFVVLALAVQTLAGAELGPGTLVTELDGTTGYRILPLPSPDGDVVGVEVASADFNNDGFGDLVLGFPTDRSNRGNTHVVYGGVGVGASGEVRLQDANGVNGGRLSPSEFVYSGSAVADAGDINGDGRPDLLIGAPRYNPNFTNHGVGYCYVMYSPVSFGGNGLFNFDNMLPHNGYRVEGELSNELCGRSVRSAGDFNGDGYADIVLGAHEANGADGAIDSGKAYVVFGNTHGASPASVQLSNLSAQQGLVVLGEGDYDYAGVEVRGIGDFNGDGYDDVAVGAPALGNQIENGLSSCYIVFGGESVGTGGEITASDLDGSNGFVFTTGVEGDILGLAIAGDVDLNEDGFDDLLIAARGANPGGRESAGSVYVVYGRAAAVAGGAMSSADIASEGFRIDGEEPGDGLGYSLDSGGDFNGDGRPDLLLGAPGFTSGDGVPGRSYVLYGSDSLGAGGVVDLTQLDETVGRWIDGDRIGFSLAFVPDTNGDGVDDLLLSSRGVGAYVVFGRAAIAPCVGDVVADGWVDSSDLAVLLASWGSDNGADTDGNGVVDAADIAVMLAAWGPCDGN